MRKKKHNPIVVSFEKFEDAVMQKILEEDTSVNRILREQYKKAQVSSRDFTGVGFYTKFHLPENIVKVTEPVEYAYGDVSCDLNGSILCGFILFIENGIMICLEGYTYREFWPTPIKKLSSLS